MKKSAILFFLPISIFAAQHWPLLVDENEVLPPGSDFISENNLATAAYVQELVGAVQVPVLSVNGMTGSVQLTAADLDALTATQASLLVSTMAPVLSVNGQTGNVQINAANIGALGADVSELSLSSLTITGTLATPRPAYAVVRLEMGEWTDYELKALVQTSPSGIYVPWKYFSWDPAQFAQAQHSTRPLSYFMDSASGEPRAWITQNPVLAIDSQRASAHSKIGGALVYVKSDDVISPTNETLQWTYLRSRGNEIESDEAGNPLWRAVCSVSWANSAPPFTRAYESAAHANFTAQHASTFVTYNGTLSAPTSVGGQDGCLTYAAADGVATTNYRIPTDFVTRQGVWYWVQFDIYATSNAPASVLLKMAFYLSDDNGTWGGGTIATGRCEMVLLSNTMLHDLSAMAVDLRNRTSQWVRVAFLFSPTAQFTARGNCLRIVPGGYWSGGALTDGLSYSIKNFTLTEIGDDGAKNAFLQNQ